MNQKAELSSGSIFALIGWAGLRDCQRKPLAGGRAMDGVEKTAMKGVAQ